VKAREIVDEIEERALRVRVERRIGRFADRLAQPSVELA
jgi:hypothetical protein